MNGNKLLYWILSALLALTLGIGGSWARSLDNRVTVLEKQYSEILRSLGRIEGKLDRLP